MSHKAGPNSPKKIASIVVKRIPRVNVPHMALLAINAADRTILQAYAKTANSVVSEKRYTSSTSPSRISSKAETTKAILIVGQQIHCKLDTGAEANVLPARIVSKMRYL